MKLRNLSSRNLYLRDSSGIEYRLNAYNDLTVSDTLWLDNEFRRWMRYRVRDIAVVDNDASVSISTLINTGDPLSVPFTIRGAVAQAVDLFQIQDSTTAVLARITKTGAIGIGVDPLTPAHIKGGITSSGGQVRIDANASNTNAALSLFPNRSGSLFEAARVLATYNGANQGQLMFYTNDGSGTLQQRVMIDETGKVGIGGSPTKALDVITAAQGDVVTFRTTASSGQGVVFGVDTTNTRAYLKLATGSTYSFGIQDISGNPMLSALNTDGKIYFGTPLDTNLYRSAADTLKTDDSFVVAGGLSVSGTATAPTPTLGDNSTNIATTAFVNLNGGSPDAPKRLYQGQLSNTAATLYTVPSSTQTRYEYARIVNNDTTARTVTLYDGGTATGNTILPATEIPAGDWIEVDLSGMGQQTGGTIAGVASVASVVTLTLYGSEELPTTKLYKRLYQGTPGTAATSLVSFTTRTKVTHIRAVNTNAAARGFGLWDGGSANSNMIQSRDGASSQIPGLGVAEIGLYSAFGNGGSIWGAASGSGTDVVFTVYGIEG